MKHSYKNQFKTELKSIFSGYPKFVYSGNKYSALDGIPVFIYHTIEPEIFEAHLIYLKKNGYKTLNIHEFYDIIKKGKKSPGKSVLLSIDDARSSVWRYAYPLLKKYEMNSVLFIIPGLTMDKEGKKINLFDFWNGKADIETIKDIDPTDKYLCTWNEISEMYNSGFVNIESHTLFHSEVFKNSNVVDFINPQHTYTPYSFPGSPYFNFFHIEKEFNGNDFVGLPLFESSPMMLAGPRIKLSEEFIQICKHEYNNFRNQNNWQIEVKKIVEKSLNNKNHIEFFNNSIDDVLIDIQKAKELIQQKLDSNAGNHLCLPWTIGSEKTIHAANEIDILSCFWGVRMDKKINRAGDDPYYITRIKNDFILRLPGSGRQSLFSIYRSKLKRRIKKQPIF
jgi:hypothetical protein